MKSLEEIAKELGAEVEKDLTIDLRYAQIMSEEADDSYGEPDAVVVMGVD